MFIIDTLVYLIFAFVMFALAKRSFLTEQKLNMKQSSSQEKSVSGKSITYKYVRKFKRKVNSIDRYLWWYIIFFTVICGFRWSVGVDSINYSYEFVCGRTLHEYLTGQDSEYLSVAIVHLFHALRLPYVFGLGFLSFLQIFFIVYSLKEHKYVLMVLPFVMFGTHFYLDLMNGVRQMIVACAFLWAAKFIIEKNWKAYTLFILLSVFVHHSALLLIPFFFVPKGIKIADKRWLCLGIFVACFILGMTPQFQGLVGYVENIAALTGYDNYSERMTEALESESGATRALGPMQLSSLFLGLATIWFGPRLKKRYEKKMSCFNIWYFFSFVYICAYFLVCNISHIFIRPVDYFLIFHLVIASLMLYDLGANVKKHRAAQMVFVTVMLIVWVNTTWHVYKADRNRKPGVTEYVTYKPFFMHMDEVRTIGWDI